MHERQNDANDKRAVKEKRQRRKKHNRCEGSTSGSMSETDSASVFRSLGSDRQSLEREKQCRPSESSARRHGDHDIMKETAEDKSRKDPRARSEPFGERAKQIVIREIPKCGVPSPAPEF